jgi:hypothetical protein
VWAEGLRIGALILLAEAFADVVLFLFEGWQAPGMSPGWIAVQLAAVLVGSGAMAALMRGRTAIAAVLTALWCVVPSHHGAISWEVAVALVVLIGLAVVRPADRRRTSAVWLLAAPMMIALWLGNYLATGMIVSPGGALVYVVALLLAVTVGVALDPRLPIAVACLSVVLMLHNSLHVSAPTSDYTERVVGRLTPAGLVPAAIAVVLLTIGYVRARRLARI